MVLKTRRRLAAIMFADIVGYSALMQKNEMTATRMRARHREVFEGQHTKYEGEIIQYFGDGVLSTFSSVVKAVLCAIDIQRLLKTGETVVPLRIGIHVGDIIYSDTEVYGDGVNVAARIESLAASGSILVSGNLNDAIKNQHQISTRLLGKFDLKNIRKPVEVFAITNDGITIPDNLQLSVNHKPQTKSIAVLPFINRSLNVEDEYFCDGMTEEIINALAKIEGLRVTSRTSSFFFKGKNIPIPEIGAKLNVSIILEGSIRFLGNQFRLTTQLIDVADDFQFFSESFDRSMEDIFTVQDEISLLIADRLREHLGHLEIADHLFETPDVSVASYKGYLKARYFILKMNKSDIDEGMALLHKVIARQPDFPLAYLGIHLGYTLQGTIGLVPAEEAFVKGKPFLEKAIELDPNLPECQLQLAYMAFLQDLDLPAAYAHLNRSREIRPTVEFYQSMASILVTEGKFEAAANYIETALQLDPLANINYHLKGFIYYCQESYEAAIQSFEKSLKLNSSFMASTLYLGQALMLSGRKEESLQLFLELKSETGDLLKLGGATLAYASLGNQRKAEEGIFELNKALTTDLMERAMNFLILCQTMLGRVDQALKIIEQAVEYKLPMMVYYFVEPLLKPLRSNNRFRVLAKQVLGEKTTIEHSNRKYKQQLFDHQQLFQLKVDLKYLMENERPYLDPGLTLRSLSQMMDLPPNHMSQILNEGFDRNFSEFINTYRLEAFKLKAADPAKRHLTILALAYESGFNSKTVFNTFFKKVMGITPRTYWKEVAEN